VQQPRGTRKGGGVFEAVVKARAIYEVVLFTYSFFTCLKNESKKDTF
jgi:hypothetical protein